MRRRVDRQTLEATVGPDFVFFFIKKPSQLEEQVYSIPLGGARVRVPWACDGSGSGYIKGFIDANFRPGNWAASFCLARFCCR